MGAFKNKHSKNLEPMDLFSLTLIASTNNYGQVSARPKLKSSVSAIPGRYVPVGNGKTCLGKDLVAARLVWESLNLRLDRGEFIEALSWIRIQQLGKDSGANPETQVR